MCCQNSVYYHYGPYSTQYIHINRLKNNFNQWFYTFTFLIYPFVHVSTIIEVSPIIVFHRRDIKIEIFFFKFKNIVILFIKISQFENCLWSQTKTSPVTYTCSWTHIYNIIYIIIVVARQRRSGQDVVKVNAPKRPESNCV